MQRVDRQSQRSSMHARHLNEQLVRVLKTISYDVGFQKGQGQYLFDRDGVRYLDLLSGFGVFAIGRNHPALRRALKSVLDSDLPNLVQLDDRYGAPGIVYCARGYHGLTYGALSLTDDQNFRGGFEPLLPGCTSVPFNDLAALEQALSSRQVAAFIVDPGQRRQYAHG